MYQICVYVPEDYTESVKNALFAAGAGCIGEYSHCAFQILGEGQFMPRPGSNPFLGDTDTIEKVREYKVELVCDEVHLQEAIRALKKAHPYETPAYYVMKLEAVS